MTTTEMTTDPRVTGKYAHRRACPVCAGSGWDTGFDCECNCDEMLRPSGAFRAAAQKVVGTKVADRIYRPGERMDGRSWGTPHRSGPTDKQVAFAEKLLRKYWPSVADEKLVAFKALNGPAARKALDTMVERSKRRQPAAQAPQARRPQAIKPVTVSVPDGHYAIASTGSNDLVFYRVDNVTEGKWAGRTFVKMIVGGRPDASVPYKNIPGILARIAADPQAAQRYGTELGQCYACNRHLTDETSRALGIGPDCRSK